MTEQGAGKDAGLIGVRRRVGRSLSAGALDSSLLRTLFSYPLFPIIPRSTLVSKWISFSTTLNCLLLNITRVFYVGELSRFASFDTKDGLMSGRSVYLLSISLEFTCQEHLAPLFYTLISNHFRLLASPFFPRYPIFLYLSVLTYA